MNQGQSRLRTVAIGDKFFSIYVTQMSKTVWRATGSYGEVSHSVSGRSDASAADKWVEWANNQPRGNY